jgi:WD40 repeat protein
MWDYFAETPAQGSGITAVDFSPDGARFAFANMQGWVSVYSVAPFAELHQQPLHSAAVNCLRWSRDGRFILTASDDKTAALYDVTVNYFRLN